MKYRFTVVLAFISTIALAQAQNETLRKKHFNVKEEIAIEGYDPVSYFDDKPREGKAEYTFVFQGVTYLFATAGNLSKFKSNPGQYEPAYGGWCAYAMGDAGEKVKIDPETYKITGGKLYLFYNFWGNNTLSDWNKSEKNLKANADKNWDKIFH
jgi:YHS domain-containing protein